MADGWRPCRAPRFAASAGGRWNAGGRRGVHLMHLEVHLKKGAGCPGAFIITRRSGATVSRTEPNRTEGKKARNEPVRILSTDRGGRLESRRRCPGRPCGRLSARKLPSEPSRGVYRKRGRRRPWRDRGASLRPGASGGQAWPAWPAGGRVARQAGGGGAVARDMRGWLLCSRGGCTYEVPAGCRHKAGDKCPQCGRGVLCAWRDDEPVHETAEVAAFFRTAEVRR